MTSQIHSMLIYLERGKISNKNILTIWEKTNLLSGHLQVHYLTGQHPFSASESSIMTILNQDIAFVRDLIVSNLEKMSKRCREHPGQSRPVVNGRAQIIYDRKRQAISLTVYSNRKRCFPPYHSHCKQ